MCCALQVRAWDNRQVWERNLYRVPAELTWALQGLRNAVEVRCLHLSVSCKYSCPAGWIARRLAHVKAEGMRDDFLFPIGKKASPSLDLMQCFDISINLNKQGVFVATVYPKQLCVNNKKIRTTKISF